MSDKKNRWEDEVNKTTQASCRLKRYILIATVSMIVILGVLYACTLLLESITAPEEETLPPAPSVTYFTPDYTCNIMEDPDYLELDRRIYITNGNERFPLTEENINQHGPAVVVLQNMINCIISGDHEGYNALFSSNYFANHKAENGFTMQRIYGIEFIKESESSHTDPETGKNYKQYEISVSYKIHKNDGTFRVDIGHDDSRKQYFILSDQTGDKLLIDQIWTYNYVNKVPQDPSAGVYAAVLIIVFAVILVAILITIIIIVRRYKYISKNVEEPKDDHPPIPPL